MDFSRLVKSLSIVNSNVNFEDLLKNVKVTGVHQSGRWKGEMLVVCKMRSSKNIFLKNENSIGSSQGFGGCKN